MGGEMGGGSMGTNDRVISQILTEAKMELANCMG